MSSSFVTDNVHALHVLGLEPTNQYEPSFLRKKVRTALLRYHPDKGGSAFELERVTASKNWVADMSKQRFDTALSQLQQHREQTKLYSKALFRLGMDYEGALTRRGLTDKHREVRATLSNDRKPKANQYLGQVAHLRDAQLETLRWNLKRHVMNVALRRKAREEEAEIQRDQAAVQAEVERDHIQAMYRARAERYASRREREAQDVAARAAQFAAQRRETWAALDRRPTGPARQLSVDQAETLRQRNTQPHRRFRRSSPIPRREPRREPARPKPKRTLHDLYGRK